jgi:hypothetical protein
MGSARPAVARMRRSRFTLASLYLAAGLGVLYLLLSLVVPAVERVTDTRSAASGESGWQASVLKASRILRTHGDTAAWATAAAALAGFVLPLLIRPARYLVWLLAVAVFLLDIAVVVGSYSGMLGQAIREANEGLGR